MHRIRLGNTVFEGENDAYLLGTEPGETTALVDTAVATSEAREQLRGGLTDHGVEFGDIDAVFLTHWHHDHTGLAGEIQRESGATVYAHEADAPLIEAEDQIHHLTIARERRLFEEWGMPADAREELERFLELHQEIAGEAPNVESVADGDRFDLGSVELEVVHLPGHAAGLAGFAFDGDGDGDDAASGKSADRSRELFAGDALLPRYTPNVGGADPRVEDPLGTYAKSLNRIVESDYARAWPGPRDPIDDPAARAREILDHHRERTENVLSVLRERGVADAWTVSADLFGDLSAIHILHGPGEAWAHLDHLERHGVVTKTHDGYDLRDSDSEPDLDALFAVSEAFEVDDGAQS